MRSLLLRRSELLLRATIVSPQRLNASSAVRAILIMASTNGVTTAPSSSSSRFNTRHQQTATMMRRAAATRTNSRFRRHRRHGSVRRAATSAAASSTSSAEDKEEQLMASFDDLSSDVRTALENLNLHSPTEIQSLAIRPSDKGGNVCIASHTGSGKTLAYLLPIIDALKREEIEADGDRLAKSRRPRALIVSPIQGVGGTDIQKVTKSLSHYAKVSRLILGGRPFALQRQNLEAPVDVVVGTPGRLVKHCEEKSLFFRGCKFVVLGQADHVVRGRVRGGRGEVVKTGEKSETEEMMVEMRERNQPPFSCQRLCRID